MSSAAKLPQLRVYGHFISQPARAVLWALAIKKLPYDFFKVVPVSGSTQTEDYLDRFPMGTIPAIEDYNEEAVLEEDGSRGSRRRVVRLTEANAILPYLAEKHEWRDLYPYDSLRRRATVDQWLHWHHNNLRPLTFHYFVPLMYDGKKSMSFQHEADGDELMTSVGTSREPQALLEEALTVMKYGALHSTPFIGGDHYTVADMVMYSELDQLEVLRQYDFAADPKFKEVHAWMQRMKGVPEHDIVRRTLYKLAEKLKSEGKI